MSAPPPTRYLLQEKRAVGDQYVYWYRWGPRAEVEVDRERLLEFVAEVWRNEGVPGIRC